MSNYVAQPSDASLKDLLDLFKKDIMLTLNCCHIATVQSFDKVNQTVSAKINYKKTIFKQQQNGEVTKELRDYPVLLDCPVFVLRGGNFSLKMPIQKGDTCIMLFNDRAIDAWFHSGQVVEIPVVRFHSLSDGMALVGISSKANLIQGFEDNAVVLSDGTHKLKVGDGEVSISVGNTVVKAGSAKVTIKNETKNLKTILQNLISTIQGLQVLVSSGSSSGSWSFNPSTTSGLSTASSDIGALLE